MVVAAACRRQVTQAAAALVVCARVLHLSLPVAQTLQWVLEDLEVAVRQRALTAAHLLLLLLLLQVAAVVAPGVP